MELLITIAYIFLIRLVFFEYRWLRFNLFWKFMVFGLYALAALTEVTMLGQYAPYSKESFVQAYVVQMAPEFGGLVTEVHAKPNMPVKKGEPLFEMDPKPWQYRVDELQAQLAAAGTDVAELNQQLQEAAAGVARTEADLEIARVQNKQIAEAAAQGAASQIRLEQSEQEVRSLEAQLEYDKAAERAAQLALDSEVGDQHTAVAEALAQLNIAKYNLEHTTVRAPSDGYAANMQLHPGGFIRLKTPVMTFVSTDEYWIVAKIIQQGAHRIAPGDKGEVAFRMYPGRVFPVEVESVLWAAGEAQGVPSGRLPTDPSVRLSRDFHVRLKLVGDHSDYPLRFGANGLVAIYSSQAAGFLILLRQIEIRSESYLNYIYNPF